MPTSTDPLPNDAKRPQPDRDRQPRGNPLDEPRDFETQVSDDDRNYHAPFDATLEPIDDLDDVNTHGSER